MILVGSRALAIRAPQVLSRKPSDFDFICRQDEYEYWMAANASKIKPTKVYSVGANKMAVEGTSNCEFEFITPGSSAELLERLVEDDPDCQQTSFGFIPTLDMLSPVVKIL